MNSRNEEKGFEILKKLNKIFIEFKYKQNLLKKQEQYTSRCQDTFDKDEYREKEVINDLQHRITYNQISYLHEEFYGDFDGIDVIDYLIKGELCITPYGRSFIDITNTANFMLSKMEVVHNISEEKYNRLTTRIEKSHEGIDLASTRITENVDKWNSLYETITKWAEESENRMEEIEKRQKEAEKKLKMFEERLDKLKDSFYIQIMVIMGIFVAIVAFVFQDINFLNNKEFLNKCWLEQLWISFVIYIPLTVLMILALLIYKWFKK